MCAYSYLRPMPLDFFHPMQRFWRVINGIAVLYFCFILVMLQHRPKYGRGLLGYMDS